MIFPILISQKCTCLILLYLKHQLLVWYIKYDTANVMYYDFMIQYQHIEENYLSMYTERNFSCCRIMQHSDSHYHGSLPKTEYRSHSIPRYFLFTTVVLLQNLYPFLRYYNKICPHSHGNTRVTAVLLPLPLPCHCLSFCGHRKADSRLWKTCGPPSVALCASSLPWYGDDCFVSRWLSCERPVLNRLTP